jgi:hypothetical protein
MDVNRLVLVAVGGFVLGILISLVIGWGDEDTLEAELARHDELRSSLGEVSRAASAVEARLGELHERVASVEKALGGVGERVTGMETALAEVEAASEERIAGVASRLEGLGSELSGAVSDVGTRVAGLVQRARAEVGGGADAGGSNEGEGAAQAAAEVEAGAGTELGIGETAHFAEGALRVFLSSVDPEAGTARVAINGPAAMSIALDEAQTVGDCTVTLTGFVARGATLQGDCAAAEAAAEADAGAGSELGIGETAQLADGSLRVFLSSVDPEAGTARVAVNGPRTQNVRLNEVAAAGDCAVTLTGFVEGGATVTGRCGGASKGQEKSDGGGAGDAEGEGQEASDGGGADPEQGASEQQAAEAEAPPDASDAGQAAAEGEQAAAGGGQAAPEAPEAGSEGAPAASGSGAELRIGQTAQFGEDGLRLFLAFVDPEAGTARVSATGMGIIALTMNEPAEAGGCTVELTGVEEGAATIEARC